MLRHDDYIATYNDKFCRAEMPLTLKGTKNNKNISRNYYRQEQFLLYDKLTGISCTLHSRYICQTLNSTQV